VFYVYLYPRAITNTSGSTGTNLPDRASQELEPEWTKRVWRSWREDEFEKGGSAFLIPDWDEQAPALMKGEWSYARCRGREVRPSRQFEKEWASEQEFIRRLNEPNLNPSRNPDVRELLRPPVRGPTDEEIRREPQPQA
jgi:hypothetical protein